MNHQACHAGHSPGIQKRHDGSEGLVPALAVIPGVGVPEVVGGLAVGSGTLDRSRARSAEADIEEGHMVFRGQEGGQRRDGQFIHLQCVTGLDVSIDHGPDAHR